MAVTTPTTLQEAIVHFSNEQVCHDYLTHIRWPYGGVKCPRCGSYRVRFMESRKKWKCYEKHARPQFSIKTGSIFEESPIGLDKWLVAVWMIVNAKNGISSYEIHRALGVTQKTAWFMGHRIRLALHSGSFERMLNWEVEVDETFIGGKARNMHSDVKARRISGRGPTDKTIVLGMLERGGIVKTKVVDDRKRTTLHREVKDTVAAGSALYSDDLASYHGLQSDYAHQTVDHAIRYVDGVVHTNTLENFWSLLKRCINGTWVSVEPFHLFRYLDEQAYRWNERRGKDGDRFYRAINQIFGKRVTYKELTGKVQRRGPKRKGPTPA